MPNKPGKAQIRKLRERVRAAVSAATLPQRERQARRGEIADEQVGTLDPRQAQSNLNKYPNYEEGSDAER